MLMRLFLAVAFWAGLDAAAVAAQDFPTRPMRLVTSAAGGGNDFIARLVAQGISVPLGQNVIVENRPSNVTGELVSKAAPDGYTMLLAGGTFLIGPLLEKTAYDPVRDFAAITLVSTEPSVLVVHSSVAANSVKELIALAKAKPGALNYASTGSGGTFHLAAELFKSMAGVNIVRVNYKGASPAINDLLGGQVQLSFISASSIAPHIKSGKVRALGLTGLQPSPQAPGLPTIASILPGYQTVGITGIYAPAKTPAVIIDRLNQEIVRFINQPDAKEKLLSAGQEIVGSTPAELAATMKSEMAKWSKLIKDARITAD